MFVFVVVVEVDSEYLFVRVIVCVVVDCGFFVFESCDFCLLFVVGVMVIVGGVMVCVGGFYLFFEESVDEFLVIDGWCVDGVIILYVFCDGWVIGVLKFVDEVCLELWEVVDVLYVFGV